MKISTFIAEDEPHSRERLKELLQNHPELFLVGEAGDGITAVRMIDELKPDLIFLDIRMPGASGFQVLERIRHRAKVIFVTAYDEFAVKAFEENAVDYLLKPTSKERMKKAVDRILDIDSRLSDGDLEKLKKALKGDPSLRRFFVKIKDEIHIVHEDEVCYFKAEDKYVFLYTQDRHYLIDMTLKELEENLDPAKFCRIHRSYIIALKKIVKLKKWFHSDYILEISNQERSRLKVSRGYKESLMRRLSRSAD